VRNQEYVYGGIANTTQFFLLNDYDFDANHFQQYLNYFIPVNKNGQKLRKVAFPHRARKVSDSLES